ncbi:hypothetical protein [Rhodococcus zopfii]|uniref:hypothetical protein n=1 Tax=Rhodococcus zopfii TaxID=43772 RepID=UPI0011147EB9|nr:hypothetical protein [Rhodococcus zopfii]
MELDVSVLKPAIGHREMYEAVVVHMKDMGFEQISTRRGKIDDLFHIDGRKVVGRGTITRTPISEPHLREIYETVYLKKGEDQWVHFSYGGYTQAARSFADTVGNCAVRVRRPESPTRLRASLCREYCGVPMTLGRGPGMPDRAPTSPRSLDSRAVRADCSGPTVCGVFRDVPQRCPPSRSQGGDHDRDAEDDTADRCPCHCEALDRLPHCGEAIGLPDREGNHHSREQSHNERPPESNPKGPEEQRRMGTEPS